MFDDDEGVEEPAVLPPPPDIISDVNGCSTDGERIPNAAKIKFENINN